MTKPDLTVDLGRGLVLKNPVLTASGTFGYGEEASAFFDISPLGGGGVKGISLEPRQGNRPPRVVETPSGMINSIGLQNVGVERFLNEKLPFLRTSGATVVVNILGGSVEEYVELAGRLEGAEGIAALEVNISCPNVKEGGVAFGMREDLASGLIGALRQATARHLMVKLSPNAGNIPSMAKAVADAGADSISLINTITAMDIDVRSRRPVLGNVIGGLSGPAVRPVALRMVWEAARAVRIPVVGLGGICDGQDAVKFLLAGASAVQVGTATFTDPMAPMKVLYDIQAYMEQERFTRLDEIVGRLQGS